MEQGKMKKKPSFITKAFLSDGQSLKKMKKQT